MTSSGPGKPVENGYIESFNGRLRDECLNGEVFFTLTDAGERLECWQRDYNHHARTAPFADRTPEGFAHVAGRAPSRAWIRQARPRVKGPLSPSKNCPPLTRARTCLLKVMRVKGFPERPVCLRGSIGLL